MDEISETDAVARLAVKAAGATIVGGPDGRAFLITPEGCEHQEITDPHGLKPDPKYIKQRVTLETADSLSEYINRFKSDQTMIFANISQNEIGGVIDFHGPAKASNMTHVAILRLPLSEEWKLWTGISGKLQKQLEFARFVEENAADVRVPDAGELLDACRDLQAHRKVNFIKAVRTETDNENFEYADETNVSSKKGSLELPTKFKLGIPVYFGEPDIEIDAFLRWRFDEGQLLLGIQLHRLEHVRQAIFKQIVLNVRDDTACPAVFGEPE